MVSERITVPDSHRFDFSMPISKVSPEIMNEVARKRNLEYNYLPEGTDVRYWEIESALEDVDERRDHQRALDAAVQEAIELYDDRSYDLILTNVDYDIRDLTEDDRATRSDKWYYGEIDMMLVNFNDNWVKGFEMKPRKGRPVDQNGNYIYEAPTHERKAEEQFRRHSFAFDRLNEEVEDFDMHYMPQPPVYETELKPDFEIPDEWADKGPDPDAQHYWAQGAKEKAFRSKEPGSFLQELVLPENPFVFSPDRELERETVENGDFVREFLDEN